MLKFLLYLCSLYLNIIATDGLDTQKLILEVNGKRIDNEDIKVNDDSFDIRHKPIIAESNLNITCKINGNNLEEPSIIVKEDQDHETMFHCTEKYGSAPCNSTSIQIPPPGVAVTCKTNSTSKLYKFALIFNSDNLPFVTVSINNRSLAVAPEHKELTYKFVQNENILVNCTHNKKLLSGMWNFTGLDNENKVRKINDQAAQITLTSEMNNSYIDCEDRSYCVEGFCQPPFVRVTFVFKDFRSVKDNKANMTVLRIINNDDSSTINTNDKIKTNIFNYKKNDMIDFTCHGKAIFPFRLTWFKDNTKFNYTYNSYLSLGSVGPLQEKDNGIEFKCTLDEVLGNKDFVVSDAQHYESIIKLQYDSDVTTPVMLPSNNTLGLSDHSGSSESYILIFGLITLLIIIIILVLIIIFLIRRSRKHKSEDELRLRTPNSSIKSQNIDSVVHVNNTYSNPKDANIETPTDNSIYETDKAYCTPFSETKEVYALPVPKKFRTNTPKAVIDLNNKNQYYSYARNFKNDFKCENSKRPYENCNSTSDGQSSLYSEINPY